MQTINLTTRSMSIDNKKIIDHGIIIDKNSYQLRPTPVTIEEIENLYTDYKNSIPDDIKYRYNYFKALPIDKLSVENIIKAKNRQETKERLEKTILDGILNHSLTWSDPKKWFWCSEKDPDLVILRKWITGGD